MTARVTSYGQEFWRRDVVSASSDGRYLTLTCENHPSPISFYTGGRRVSVLICADDSMVTQALREEHPDGAWRRQ